MIFGTLRRMGWSAVAAVAASLLWLLLCAFYIQSTIGWSQIFTLLPHEFGSLFTGIFAPLAFLWLVMAYAGRGLVLRDTAEALQTELGKLTYPVDETEARVGALDRLAVRADPWPATKDRVHRTEAKRVLAALREHAPTEYRDSIGQKVPLYSEVAAF